MIIHGDSLFELQKLESNSVDAVVTDPPYGLAFMNKKWDYDVPSVELWREVFRVLKPGGHVLSFGGTRTYHRMVVNIEDAGFEIRDQIQWIYGSGFPKSTNVALRIDKEAGAIGNRGKGFNAAGQGISLNQNKELRSDHPDYVAPEFKTDSAKQWQGWGTALKPANEPIVLARKPLKKGLTVAENVLKYGTGALNIDGCRIEGQKRSPEFKNPDSDLGYHGGSSNKNLVNWDASQGRWPANILFDETAAEMLDAQSGKTKSGKLSGNEPSASTKECYGDFKNRSLTTHADFGGASRFFYVAKASKRERNAGLEGMPQVLRTDADGLKMPDPRMEKPQQRVGNENHHPTVKPIKLMEYLCRLITPPGGVILDPFMGSGSTGVAAKNLNFKFIGIEREKEYCAIAEKRINQNGEI